MQRSIAAALAFLLGACGEPVPPIPQPGPVDAHVRPRRDAEVEATPDAAPADAGIPSEGPCVIDYATDLTVVGRDTDRSATPRVATAASDEALVAVFVDDAGGSRRVRAAQAIIESSEPISRIDLDAIPEGASSPAILPTEEGWLVAYRRPEGGIAVQSLDRELAGSGAASTISDAGDRPMLTAIASGALVVWSEGLRLLARAVAVDGRPDGEAFELGTMHVDGAGVGAHAYGAEGGALVAFGGTEGSAARVTGRAIGGDGAPAPAPIPIGATSEATGSIGVGSATPGAPPGVSPLLGATVFDVLVDGAYPEVRFVLVDGDGGATGEEFAVSESGERSWGSSVAAFRDGYVVAQRARPRDDGFSRVQLAFLGRESCRLGRVDSRLTAGVSASEEGSATSIAATDSTLFVAWAETLVDAIEYRVARARCP